MERTEGASASPPCPGAVLLCSRLLTRIEQRAACEQRVALTLGNFAVRLEGSAAADDSDLLTVLDLFEDVRQRDVVEQLDGVIVRRVCEVSGIMPELTRFAL